MGVGVGEVELQAMRHPLSQADLHRVVVCVSDRPPSVQGVELAVEVRVRPQNGRIVVERARVAVRVGTTGQPWFYARDASNAKLVKVGPCVVYRRQRRGLVVVKAAIKI